MFNRKKMCKIICWQTYKSYLGTCNELFFIVSCLVLNVIKISHYFQVVVPERVCPQVVMLPIKRSRKRNTANPWPTRKTTSNDYCARASIPYRYRRHAARNILITKTMTNQTRSLETRRDSTMTTNPSPQGAATLHCFIKRKAKDASCIPISEESFGGK